MGEPSNELNKAVNNKEWLLANNLMNLLMDKKPRLCEKIISYMFAPHNCKVYTSFGVYKSESEGGICPKCVKIIRRPEAENCPKCGSNLIKYCKTCNGSILIEQIDGTPNYCTYCGDALFPIPKKTGKTNPQKKTK